MNKFHACSSFRNRTRTHCLKTKCVPSYRRLLTPHSSLDWPCFMMGSLLLLIGMTSYSLASLWCRTADYIESVICLRLWGPPFRLHCLLVPHLDGVIINYTWQPKYLTISLLVLVSLFSTFISNLRHFPNVPVQMLTWFFFLLARKSPEHSAGEESGAHYLFIKIIVKLYDWVNFMSWVFNQPKQALAPNSKFKHLLVIAKAAGRPVVQNSVSWGASRISIYPW
jgi:hypothetical protein